MTFRILSVAMFLSVGLVMGSSTSWAQEEGATSGRLPPYYKDVVSEAQKKEIYQIQTTFDDKLEALEKQYESLTAELKKLRDSIDSIRYEERAAVEKVLTPKQLAQVKQKQAEAQAKLAQELLKAAQEAAQRAEALAESDE